MWTFLTVESAASILEELGSDLDPVFYRGRETTAADLRYSEYADRDAFRMRVEFYPVRKLRSRVVRVRGTLRDMILDRLGAPRRGLKRVRRRRR